MIAGADILTPLQVQVTAYKKKRSIDQNSLYWCRISEIVKHIRDTTGNSFSSDDVHGYLVEKYLPKRVIEIGGVAKPVSTSTTSLKVMEFILITLKQ